MPHFTARQLFQQYVAQTSDAPLMLEIDYARGSWLYGKNEKKYLDLISGIAVSNVGHSHPKIIEAIQSQITKHMHLMVYGEYIQSTKVKLAEKLVSLLPQSLTSVYFTNSGTEATEGALKLAKRASGRAEIVYAKGAYHGSTSGALSVMGDEYYRQNYRPLIPGNRMIRYNEMDDVQLITTDTAAVILETVQAETGVTVPKESWIQAIRKRCVETGALLILDEAQCGMGRTGKWFAFEHFDVEPDILLLAKSFGGGMPLGAFVSSEKLMNHLQSEPVLGHITTFGGHPVCCAAGLANIQVLEDESLIENVQSINAQFVKQLKHPAIRDLRHAGAMIAIQFDTYENNKKIIDICIENGVITDWFLYNPSALRIAPPLNISESEIQFACTVINEAIGVVLS